MSLYSIFMATFRAVLPLVFLGSGIFAQTADTENKAAPEGETRVVYAQKDWLVRCFDQQNAASCEALMAADVILNGTQLPAFRLAFSPYEAKGKLLVIFVPHDHPIYLPNGIELYVDRKKVVTYPVTNCTVQGCFVQKIADKRLINGFKRGSNATLRIALMSGKNLDVDFSLLGFTAAMRDLERTGPVIVPEGENDG